MQPDATPAGPPPLPPRFTAASEPPPFIPPPPRRGRRGVKIAVGLIVILFFGLFSMLGLLSFFTLVPLDSFKLDSGFGGAVAVLDIDGAMLDPAPFRQQLERLKNDPSIRAVVVRIESPGGAVGTAQEIYTELCKLRDEERLTVIAAMGNMAASGGYYAALGANYVFAYEGTVTGSIGVLMNLINTEGLLDKVGVELGSLTSGELKDVPSYTRNLTEMEKQYLQSTVDSMYDQFLFAVIENRAEQLKPRLKEKIEQHFQLTLKDENFDRMLEKYLRAEVADGRIFTGKQALELGLIDEIGTYSDALEKALEIAGLGAKAKVKKLKRTPTFLEMMSGQTKALAQSIKPEFSFQYRVRF